MSRHRLWGPSLFLILASVSCSAKHSKNGPAAEPSDVSSVSGPAEATKTTQPDAQALPSDALTRPPEALARRLTFERIHRGLSKPLGLEFFSGDPLRRLFVVEQTGTVRAITAGVIETVPLLDVRQLIGRKHNEQGLLGLAFHPEFAKNGLLYVNYTAKDDDTRVVQYKASTGPDARVDPASAVELLRLEQPWRNHNGGYLEFGPDGGLYVGTGDGGAANDPKRVAQLADHRLGKMLRIDVQTKRVDIVQTGLRNPWRYTFDPKTHDLYVADVGQNKWEEVSVVSYDELEGANFGWSIWEGKHCFREKDCSGEGMISPAIEFDHETGCSITGGIVYRGTAIPELDGAYFYSDYCTAILRSFRWKDGVVRDHWDWKAALDPGSRLAEVSAFAADADGEMYLLSSGGGIYKLVEKSP